MRLVSASRFVLLVGLSLAFGATQLPVQRAFAQSNSAGLDLVSKAAKSLEAGAYTDAKNSVDEAFKVGLDNDLAARAMLIRAQANEKTGKLSGALSDYSGALFMQTLPTPERKKATAGKERVTAAMGLNSGSGKKAADQGSGQQATSSSEGQSSGGVAGFFNNIFGTSEQAAQPAPKPAQTGFQTQTSTASSTPSEAATKPAAKPAAARVASPPKTEAQAPKPAPAPVRQAAAAPARQAAVPQPRPSLAKAVAAKPETVPASAKPADGGFLIDFGGAAGESAARAKAQQIKTQLADILVNRELIVQPGSGGFRVVAGPYKAKNAAASLCSAMKARGVTCQVTP